MFDTNIYGLLAELPDAEEFLLRIAYSGIMVCGSKVVRKELRDIPLGKTIDGKNLRSVTLSIYDTLVKEKRNYSITAFVEELSQDYKRNYAGKSPLHELENDFLIAATASVHHLDIVCSDDRKTMASKESIIAYNEANRKYELPTPKFIKFGELENIVRSSTQ